MPIWSHFRAAATLLTAAPLAFCLAACIQSGAAPPGPPDTGPGSPSGVASDIRTTVLGTGGQQIFIYEPLGTGRSSAPVIVFLHGYGMINPRVYGAWIKHLVQRGNTVLYPVYQDSLTHAADYTPSALAAVQNAYATLRAGGHLLPDDTQLAILGQSLGGTIGMNLAAAQNTGFPPVRALLAANAGDADTRLPLGPSIQASNYDQIPADMLFLGVVGADDTFVGSACTISFWNQLTQIPVSNREVIELHSDYHGFPPLMSTHDAAAAFDDAFNTWQSLTATAWLPSLPNSVNALDYYGFWKWLDALTDAAFYGPSREYALGDTPEQVFLGTWSDGQPVAPAVRIKP